MPSFRVKGHQFTPQQALRSRVISSARSHVERVNARIKKYKIFELIHYSYRGIASTMLTVVCSLVNMQNSIIAKNNGPLKKIKF